MAAIDLNSDLGESYGAWRMGDDAAMLAVVSSANIACGFHAGDPAGIYRTVKAAAGNGVVVGAHVSYPDRVGFGRRDLDATSEELIADVIYQIGAIKGVATAAGTTVRYVKPHGALYNRIAYDARQGLAVIDGIKAVDPALVYVVMPGLSTERAAEKLGLPMAREVFADRTYDDSGNLTSRKVEGAVIHDAAMAAQRVLRMVEDQEVVTVTGKRLKVKIDTICVHGDNPAAVAMAKTVRDTLEAAGIAIRPFRAG